MESRGNYRNRFSGEEKRAIHSQYQAFMTIWKPSSRVVDMSRIKGIKDGCHQWDRGCSLQAPHLSLCDISGIATLLHHQLCHILFYFCSFYSFFIISLHISFLVRTSPSFDVCMSIFSSRMHRYFKPCLTCSENRSNSSFPKSYGFFVVTVRFAMNNYVD